jgi:hypothetical protein
MKMIGCNENFREILQVSGLLLIFFASLSVKYIRINEVIILVNFLENLVHIFK